MLTKQKTAEGPSRGAPVKTNQPSNPPTLQYLNTAVHAAGPRCERSAAVSTAVEGLTSQHCSSTAVEGSFFGYIPFRIHYVSRHCSEHCSNMDILTSFSVYTSFGYMHCSEHCSKRDKLTSLFSPFEIGNENYNRTRYDLTYLCTYS